MKRELLAAAESLREIHFPENELVILLIFSPLLKVI